MRERVLARLMADAAACLKRGYHRNNYLKAHEGLHQECVIPIRGFIRSKYCTAMTSIVSMMITTIHRLKEILQRKVEVSEVEHFHYQFSNPEKGCSNQLIARVLRSQQETVASMI